MNNPNHKETVFLETVQANAFAGEIHKFYPYSPLPEFEVIKEEVTRIVLNRINK
jgi:hypothetical protein